MLETLRPYVLDVMVSFQEHVMEEHFIDLPKVVIFVLTFVLVGKRKSRSD